MFVVTLTSLAVVNILIYAENILIYNCEYFHVCCEYLYINVNFCCEYFEINVNICFEHFDVCCKSHFSCSCEYASGSFCRRYSEVISTCKELLFSLASENQQEYSCLCNNLQFINRDQGVLHCCTSMWVGQVLCKTSPDVHQTSTRRNPGKIYEVSLTFWGKSAQAKGTMKSRKQPTPITWRTDHCCQFPC